MAKILYIHHTGNRHGQILIFNTFNKAFNQIRKMLNDSISDQQIINEIIPITLDHRQMFNVFPKMGTDNGDNQ